VPTFLNQPLLWGLGLTAVPVIIHLINMMRHRRVQWAAMEFLLASQRKHSTWIRLKELLLLLMRVAAIAAIVLIVARPRLDGGLSKRLGDAVTHHIVLLDDSFSMSERFGDRGIFDRAKQAVEQIAVRALDESSAQTFTLLRASRAGAAGGAQPDLFAETVNSELVFRDRDDRKLNRLLETIEPSDFGSGPDACFKGLANLLKPNEAEERIVYLISDFRSHDWQEPEELRNRLVTQKKQVTQLYFVNCADEMRGNLAVVSLRPESGTRAAGVHFFMQVEVRNFGRSTANNVAVEIRTDDESGGVIFLEQIDAGRSAVGRFPVFFSKPGEHLISVSLEPDAIDVDNRRYAALDVAEELPVLVIDGLPEAGVGRRVAEALAPPGPVRSGLAPKVQPVNFMNDAEQNPLLGFRTVFVCNVDRLEEAAVRNLEAFVEGGGGVCFLVGERTQPAFFNERLYRDGAGLFPLPLDAEKPLFRPTDAGKSADIAPSKHPVFRLFGMEQNSYLYDVTVRKYFGVRSDWTPDLGQKQHAEVIASLRNGAPLAAEKTYGRGRVIALLTLPTDPFSDWARNGSFVVTALELQSYLAPRDDSGGDDRRVGTVLVETGDPQTDRPELSVQMPHAASGASTTVQAVASPTTLRWEFADTRSAGFYRVQKVRQDDSVSVRSVPFNVDPLEGDLARSEESDLRERLDGVPFHFRQAERFLPAESETAATSGSTLFLYLLALLLLGEQALAYAASYHAPAGEVRK
jgi:hypothetical protein